MDDLTPTITAADEAARRLACLLDDQRVLLLILPPGVNAVTVHLCQPVEPDAVDERILSELRHANRDGVYPSVPELSARTGMAYSTLYARLAALEVAGYAHRPNGPKSGYASHSEHKILVAQQEACLENETAIIG